MGKIYFIVYMFGKIAMVMHWPDGAMEACEHARDLSRQTMDEKFATISPDDPAWRVDGKQLTRKDVTSACEYRNEKPAIDNFTH